MILLLFISGYYYIEVFLNYKRTRKYLILLLLFVISIVIYFDALFFDKLNFYMLNLQREATGNDDYTNINNFFALFAYIIKNFLLSFINFNNLSLFKTIVYIENLFILVILTFTFFKALNKKQYISIYWIISIVCILGFIDTVVPNFGSSSRYKFNIFFIFLISFYYSTFIKNKNV